MQNKLIKRIHDWEKQYTSATDEELQEETRNLKNKIHKKNIFQLLPQVYALVGEASKRVLGMYPYDVQFLGAISLARGEIAQMRTGEGKTLVAAMPSFLYALFQKGVHVVTVIDYLAKRDAEQIGKIHTFLGLSVGVVLHDMDQEQRRVAYQCDITYVTNSELGFDYLRDNMVMNIKDRVQRGFFYCIIDEADSILIDEARTPLILSGSGENTDEIYHSCDDFVRTLKKGSVSREMDRSAYMLGLEVTEDGDFIINEKDHSVYLTASGIKKAEDHFGIQNLNTEVHARLYHAIQMSLQAHHLMKKDCDYMVSGDMVYIVDEFTGRVMDGRRYSNGLHQALEAKEHVTVQTETKTYASVTYQHFFKKYEKISGMTGTADSDRREFWSAYHLMVKKIPTNRPVIRQDDDDRIFQKKEEKFTNIIAEIKFAYQRKQPVLVGTADIITSESLSQMLTDEGIPHQVLHAKYHEREARIVETAGHACSVTIATNMAGRGTDIKLDPEAKEAGGLYVIGTEHFESKRIDDQLRGRSGRQGDTGRSIFFVSLEDKLYRMQKDIIPLENRYGNKRNKERMDRIQKATGLNYFGQRKSLLEYGTVDDIQREMFYRERNSILEQGISEQGVSDLIRLSAKKINRMIKANGREKSLAEFRSWLNDDMATLPEQMDARKIERLIGNYYRTRHKETNWNEADIVKECLTCMDWLWVKHMVSLHQLLPICRIQALGQRNPRSVYRREAFALYEEFLSEIAYMTLGQLFHSKPKSSRSCFTLCADKIIRLTDIPM